jgi:hypothetical protein
MLEALEKLVSNVGASQAVHGLHRHGRQALGVTSRIFHKPNQRGNISIHEERSCLCVMLRTNPESWIVRSGP